MRRLLIAAALLALAVAKPEMYKETEDFQYSRSSTDEGSKSGFYGAQRGNMGGNFEKAHNMDGLAQHQMSGLVRQVDGEVGDGYKTRTGSVYSAANSRGIYGSGNYDLSNLQGRNFGETEAFDGRSHSSSISQSAGLSEQSLENSAAYSNSRAHSAGYRRYQSGSRSQNFMQSGNLQTANRLHSEDSLHTADNLHTANEFDYGSQAGQYSNAGYQAYDQSNMNSKRYSLYGLNTRGQLVGAAPVRVVVRPGKPVTVPLTAQTYDASRSTLTSSHNNLNTDAELLSQRDSQQLNNGFATAPKHYESSYSYRKQWEKHNTQPVAIEVVPTENPFSSQSESLGVNQATNLENSQHQSASSYNTRASNSAYAANTKSAISSQSRYQTGYNAKQGIDSGLLSNVYNSGSHLSNADTAVVGADNANMIELLNTKPKSYHSSYSYHKSWERQGDPYVIQPVGETQGGQTSQRLTAASLNHGAHSSHHYESQYNQGHQSLSQNGLDCDCDENGHARVTRSAAENQEQQFETYQNFNQHSKDFGQQTQSRLEDLQDLGQQAETKWDALDLTGYNQEQMDNSHLEQQNEHQWGLHNLGQQTEKKFDIIEDLEQQQMKKLEKLEDFGQESQSQWYDQQDLGQHTQERLEDLGQQTQNKWDQLEDLGQQAQNGFENIEDSNQQLLRNLEQHIQQHRLEESKTNNFEHFSQQSQDNFNQFNLDTWSMSEDNKQDFHNNFWGHYQNPLYFNSQHPQDGVQAAYPSTHQFNRNYKASGSGGVDQYTGFSFNSSTDESSNDYNRNTQKRTEESLTSNSLSSIWDKIDNIAKKTLKDDNDDVTQKPIQESPNWLQKQNTNESNGTSHPLPTETDDQVGTTESTLTPPNVIKNPDDIGRGDIGPEDIENIFDASNKSYKTPQEIEALSLTQNEGNNYSQLSLENSNKDSVSHIEVNEKEKFIEELLKDILNTQEEKIIISTSSTTPSTTTSKPTNNLQQSRNNDFDTQKNFDTSNKPYRTQQEIEALSLTHNEGNNYSQLSLENSNKDSVSHIEVNKNEKFIEELFKDILNMQEEKIIISTSSTTPSTTTSKPTNNLQQSRNNDFDTQKNFDTSNKPYRTQQEIEALSLTHNEGNNYSQLSLENSNKESVSQSVLNKNEQSLEDFFDELLEEIVNTQDEKVSIFTSSITPSTTSKSTNYLQQSRINDFNTQVENNEFTQEQKDTKPLFEQQQNVEQQFDFSQQTQDLGQQTQDLGQQLQEFGQQTQDLDQTQSFWDTDNLEATQNQDINNSFQVQSVILPKNNFEQQQKIQTVNVNELSKPELPYINQNEDSDNIQLNQNKQTLTLPEYEKVTEKPGLWSSLTTKLKKAKDSVYSWFRNT